MARPSRHRRRRVVPALSREFVCPILSTIRWGHFHTAFSPDGVSAWEVACFSMAFNATIALQSGGSLRLIRRERHQVVFDSATGVPAFLFNGAMLAGATGDHSFTTVQPILH